MGNHPRPLTVIRSHLSIIKQSFHAVALRDGVYDPEERAVYQLLDHLDTVTEEHDARQQWGSLIEKGGDIGSEYMNGIAATFGVKIVPIEAAPSHRTVIPFRRRREPDGAA